VCGSGLQFSRAGKTKTQQSARYRCGAASRGLTETSGHGQRNMRELDKYVTDALFLVIDAQEYLPDPVDDVTVEMDDLRQRLNDAADQYAEGLIDGEQMARISSRLRPQIAALEVKQTGQGLRPTHGVVLRHGRPGRSAETVGQVRRVPAAGDDQRAPRTAGLHPRGQEEESVQVSRA